MQMQIAAWPKTDMQYLGMLLLSTEALYPGVQNIKKYIISLSMTESEYVAPLMLPKRLSGSEPSLNNSFK